MKDPPNCPPLPKEVKQVLRRTVPKPLGRREHRRSPVEIPNPFPNSEPSTGKWIIVGIGVVIVVGIALDVGTGGLALPRRAFTGGL